MEGIDVDYTDNTKYLGVHLDTKLSWTLHFNKITAKAKQYLMYIMSAVNKNGDPNLV